jgi:AraC-like DNA-binding protein
VASVLAAAPRVGLDPKRLLALAGMSGQQAQRGGLDEHVPLSQYFALWDAAMADGRHRHLPIRAATALGTDSFGVIGFACMTSPTIAEGFARLTRYYNVLSTAAHWSLETEGKRVLLMFSIAQSPGLGASAAAEFALAEAIHFGRMVAARPLPVVETRFVHAAPADDSHHRNHFRSPIVWNAPHSALVLERDAFEVPLAKSDPHLLAYFERQADELASRHKSEEALSARVQRIVVKVLPSGPPALEDVARQLGISARSLRRHLAEEETSFQGLVEQTRTDLAKRYLQDPRLTVSEIAFLVGFSDLSPFQRAFRRWTDLTPGAYRERAIALVTERTAHRH